MSNEKEKLHQEKMMLAEFYFDKEDFDDIKEFPGLYLPEYDIDRNPLHKVWEKFRELEMPKMKSALDDYNIWLAKVRHTDKICIAMTRGTLTDLYNALVEAVKWYNEVTKQKQ